MRAQPGHRRAPFLQGKGSGGRAGAVPEDFNTCVIA